MVFSGRECAMLLHLCKDIRMRGRGRERGCGFRRVRSWVVEKRRYIPVLVGGCSKVEHRDQSVPACRGKGKGKGKDKGLASKALTGEKECESGGGRERKRGRGRGRSGGSSGPLPLIDKRKGTTTALGSPSAATWYQSVSSSVKYARTPLHEHSIEVGTVRAWRKPEAAALQPTACFVQPSFCTHAIGD